MTTTQASDINALADALAKHYGHHFTTTRDGIVTGEHRDFTRHPLVGKAVRALRDAALAALQPPGDLAVPPDWRPFGLTVEAALNRGDDPALLFDENSPIRGELRRLLGAPAVEPVVDIPAAATPLRFPQQALDTPSGQEGSELR